MKEREFNQEFVRKLNPPVFEYKPLTTWTEKLYMHQVAYKRRNPDARDLKTEVALAVCIGVLLLVCYTYSNELQAFFNLSKEVKGGR
jgi:hypothetical protein